MNIQGTNSIASASIPLSSSPVAVAKGVSVSKQSSDSQAPSAAQLQNAVENMSKAVKQNHTNLDISVDKTSDQIIVKIVDTSTGDIVSQYPSKVAIAISESIGDKQQGVLLNKKA